MSAFGDFLKSDSGGKVIGSVIGFGGGLVLSNQEKQKLKQQSADIALQAQSQVEVARLQVEKAKIEASKASAGESGNTMLYVGLGIGAVVILGVVIFAVTRKKSE
jgi:hypothetical protein